MERGRDAVRGRTRSIAAIDCLRRTERTRLAAQVDGDSAGAAILESIAGIGVAIADLIEDVAGPVPVAEAGFLSELVAQGAGLVDLALRVQASRSGEGRRCEAEREAGGQGEPERMTHGNTCDVDTRSGNIRDVDTGGWNEWVCRSRFEAKYPKD